MIGVPDETVGANGVHAVVVCAEGSVTSEELAARAPRADRGVQGSEIVDHAVGSAAPLSCRQGPEAGPSRALGEEHDDGRQTCPRRWRIVGDRCGNREGGCCRRCHCGPWPPDVPSG